MNSLPKLPFDLSLIEWEAFLSYGSILTSLAYVAAIVITRSVLMRHVRRDDEILAKEQRSWIIRIKNTAAILIVIGLILIWAPQLHTFALSITAFAVALVIATKEMILCLTGAIMRATSNQFKVGEWVTVDDVTGEVIDMDALSFRLQEVDMEGKTYQFTGQTITVPNSKLFTSKVVNANFFKAYIFEDVRVNVQYMDVEPAEAMDALKAIAEKYFEPYKKDAIAFNKKIRKKEGVDIGSAQPLYDLTTSEFGHYRFHARLFLPTAQATNVGADICEEFLAYVHKMRLDAVAAAKAQDVPAAAAEPVKA